MTLRAIDALLFDLGGVVLRFDFDRAFALWSACSGEPTDTLRSRFSFDVSYERHERGEIPAGEYFASLRSSLGIELSDDTFAEGWKAIFIGAIPEVIELLRRLKDRIPLYAFTNSNPTLQEALVRGYSDTLTLFQRVFVSCEMGKRKPEPEAFAAIAADIGVPLGRILFLDDMVENVEGARAVGMQVVHVQSVADVESTVERFLR